MLLDPPFIDLLGSCNGYLVVEKTNCSVVSINQQTIFMHYGTITISMVFFLQLLGGCQVGYLAVTGPFSVPGPI